MRLSCRRLTFARLKATREVETEEQVRRQGKRVRSAEGRRS
jgi:hypothetical protein